jgi:archaellum biogenesis ATPase FlaH
VQWDIFFKVFLSSKEIFFGYSDMIPPSIFGNAIQTNLFILIQKFATKYKRIPDFDTLILLLEKLPESEKQNRAAYVEFIDSVMASESSVDLELFEDELRKAIQDYEIEQFILQTANKVGKVTVEDVLSNIQGLMTKIKPKSVGVDVTNVEQVVKTIRHDASDRISTGLVDLDRALFGGYGTDEIFIALAPPGKGKSYYLINAMYYAMLAGHNALYITCELSERAVLRRLYSRVSFTSKKDMLNLELVAVYAKKFFTLSKAQGRVIYFPGNSLSVSGIESLLEQQNLYFGFKPNILLVDYLDRLAPRPGDREPRHQLRNITDDLRSIALKRNIPIVTATQANRASLAKVKITEANVSESFGKVEVADVVAAICQTDQEKIMNRMRLVLVKNREYVGGASIELYQDLDKMFLSDLEMANRLGLLTRPPHNQQTRQTVAEAIRNG